MNELYLNFFKASTAVIFLLLIDFAAEYFLIKKIKDAKRSIKFRVRLRYFLFACLLFFMAKIWVEGFGYLLTVVGVIAAALTITQKEYLMNLVGWLIIMWRDFFVEGDYIEVGKYTGYVEHIGPLFFSIQEASDVVWGEKTGRVVKIPNSLIATNPILNFSISNAFVEGKLVFIFTFQSSLVKIYTVIDELTDVLNETTEQCKARWNSHQCDQYQKMCQTAHYKPQFVLRVSQEKPSGIQLKVRFFSLKQDQKGIEDKLAAIVIAAVQRDPQSLGLSVAT